MGFRIYEDGKYPDDALEIVEFEGVTFHCRPILVGDMHTIQAIDRDDATGAMKVMASTMIIRIEGLENGAGEPITELTDSIIEAMPMSMAAYVVKAISATAIITTEEENTSGAQSDT